MSKSSELDQTVKSYLLEAIDPIPYSNEAVTNKELIAFLIEAFEDEHGFNIERKGRQKALAEWLSGLPSIINIPYASHEILQLATKWGSLAPDATEKQEDAILANYWTFMAAKLLQLADGYRMPADDTQAMLSRVEAYQEDTNGIASEQALSDMFDNGIEDMVDPAIFTDGPMMRECFNNWSDSLCKDGELHPLQYDQYCNVGRYADV